MMHRESYNRSTQPSFKALGFVFAALALVGASCVGEHATEDPVTQPNAGIDADFAEFSQPLAFTGSCAFATGAVTLIVNSGDSVIVSKRVTDTALLVNNTPCGNANVANVKTLNINETSAGPETVVLDYENGLFAMGSATAGTGTFVNFGTNANDKLKLRMTTGADTVVFGAGGANLNGDVNKDITFTALPAAFAVALGAGNDSFSGAGDTVTGAALTGPVSVYGGDGTDTLKGGNGNDLISGDDGDDSLDAEAMSTGGADTFDGGNGNDTLSYASRANDMFTTIGDTNNDDGEANEGDTIYDTIETLIAGNGNDKLSGSLNPNMVKIFFGGNGNDTFIQRNAGTADSRDTLNGGAGIDTVDYSARTIGVVVTMDGVAGNDGSTGENDWVKSDIENCKGGTGNDTVTGNPNGNVINGGQGNNTLSGMDGDDYFDQSNDANNTGIDIIAGGNGVDTVDYSGRTNAITVVLDGNTASGDLAASEADKVGSDVENARGGSGADSLTGSASNNELTGNGGDDTLFGLAGDDTLNGGTTGETSGDTLDCGAGSDIAIDGETDNANCEIIIP